MNEKDAKNVILQAIEIAQKSGVYTIKDSALIFQAMSVLGINLNDESPETNNQQDIGDKENK